MSPSYNSLATSWSDYRKRADLASAFGRLQRLANEPPDVRMAARIIELPFPKRIYSNFVTDREPLVADVVRLSARELWRIPNIGHKTVHIVEQILTDLGFSLGMNDTLIDLARTMPERDFAIVQILQGYARDTIPAHDAITALDEIYRSETVQ